MDLNILAKQLINELVERCHSRYGFSSMTCTVYDTAWVSMVSKPVEDTRVWLFPASFESILRTQIPNGGWNEGTIETDSILDTAAALYALCKHRRDYKEDDLEGRISSAAHFLTKRLNKMDLSGILPSLLKIREQKLARIDFDKIYRGAKSSILHSLEAFIGEVDFDRLSHHKVVGSMMASPSSTAAYLMNCSTWDDESEEYLRYVVETKSGTRTGDVPSAFPSTLFETSWVLSTLLESGFTEDDLGPSQLQKVKKYFMESFTSGSGLIGFAPLLEADADDTAKGITMMSLLGVPISVSPLIERYSDGEKFRTYSNEITASISTNSNVLTAMCMAPLENRHRPAIEMVVKFLCETWWKNSHNIRDKWVRPDPADISLHKYLGLYDKDYIARRGGKLQPRRFSGVSATLHDAVIVLFQSLSFLLVAQREDGSWQGKRESTALAVITINIVASLPIVRPLLGQVKTAIDNGCMFLSRNLESKPERIWIEKVTYGSQYISDAFTLAALRYSDQDFVTNLETSVTGTLDAILKPLKFFRQLPMFSCTPEWSTVASLIEGSLFESLLRKACFEVFPDNLSGNESHFSFIPFTWTSGNNLHSRPLTPGIMLEMMIISALAYQMDEFIESKVAKLSIESVKSLRKSVMQLFDEVISKTPDVLVKNAGPLPSDSLELHQVCGVFKAFISYIWYAPYNRIATQNSRAQLRIAVEDFLIAHLTQTEDNYYLARQSRSEQLNRKFLQPPKSSLLDWVRTTSGDHTAGPFAFTAFISMLGNGTDCLNSPLAKYVAQDVSRHLAALCRLYNDFGSVTRDMAEGNLNSVNFPEFGAELEIAKKDLLRIGEYERRCLNQSLAELRPLVDEAVFASLQVFCTSADMYGEMYVIKDLTPAIK
ncbi:uncharacterized protein F4812DRAFT_452953 [Daldinia caldariorum]|uniref:uncharacterized protein n=1 Tax=Daldinia caldariorum TaxID=326644 RepID=UPI002007440C|nr:uncharacterized protein F4812DRAFT_452953 [Daldinia caldariorum]KAI1464316.1 hypothetical protein F4812DRAFT_452953 [Daldinia caldariorum]